MCGVFGFITSDGHGPEIARLRRLALVTQSRGAHAFGLAWLDADGEIQTFKQPGPASRYLDELNRCRDAVVMIGHCRYATHGSPRDNRNNHPHVAGAGVIVHNGVIHNHQQLVQHYRLAQQSQCDSEVLGLLMARGAGSIARRSAWTANQARGDLAILGIWRAPARMLVARRGKPLHIGRSRHGFYFASLPDGLPGKAKPVADNSTRVLAYDEGLLRLEDDTLRIADADTLP
ncbi:MAG: hypothetical protein GX591_01145 [Planctomycetes bacterium]|nr:hypothetical protein [Planctomycetota bacterium]